MLTKDIKFSEFTPRVAKLLTQALYIALANDSGVDGPFKEDDQRLTRCVLHKTLQDRTLHIGTDTIIYDELQYAINDFELWVNGRDESQTPEQAIKEYNQQHGCDFNADTIEILKYLAFNLSQQSSISSTLDGDSNLDICLRLCNKVVDNAALQHHEATVGIVVNGVMFTFANDSIIANAIKDAVEKMAASKEV